MTEVWLAETGAYEDNHVVGVYATADDAVTLIKATYKHPYKVEWLPLESEDDGSLTLKARFSAVRGYSTEHEASWWLYAVEVQSVPPDRKGSQ